MSSIEALWSVTFASNVNLGEQGLSVGGGIVVMETGRILGGDVYMLYVGDYRVPQGRVAARINVRTYRKGGTSIFGPLERYTLELTGDYKPDRFRLVGHMVERPDFKIAVDLERQEELP